MLVASGNLCAGLKLTPVGCAGAGVVARSAHRLSRLSLNGSDRNRVDNVFGLATTGEIVGGSIQALQDRADRRRASQPLGPFISDVAGLQIGKDEHVGTAADA